MGRLEQFSAAAEDLGTVLRYISFATAVPILVTIYYEEWDMVMPMLTAPLLLFLIGTTFICIPKGNKEPQLSHALFSVAFIWIICAAISAVPFTLGINMPYLDAFFEAMSGWTDTGMTMITNLDEIPNTLLFWRSLMEWLGGLGIVAFTVVMLSRTSLNPSRFYRSEARTEAFVPSAIQQGVEMWKIYVVLTVAAIAFICISGIPIWDAVNIAMTAISTGGFTIHTEGLAYYDNPLLEMLIIPVMIAGAIPFKIYYFMYYKRKFSFVKDAETSLLLALIMIGFAVLLFDLFYFSRMEVFESLRYSIFMAVSGITSTGFQTTSPGVWAPATTLFLAVLMFIGGSSGSTAGGIKLSRASMAYRGIVWWIRRSFKSANVIIPFRIGHRIISKTDAELEVSKNMLVIFLYIGVIFVSAILVMHFEPLASDSSEVIFDVISASCNNGISTGIISPELTPMSKILFIFAMWIGRLEIIPVIVFFMYIFRGFHGDIK
ncbi:MAG: TrkH family potassium uptake protein [Methanomicrobium sp.]|nr:TrkH family potassium uptake protein [Methanomicrobium sp.]